MPHLQIIWPRTFTAVALCGGGDDKFDTIVIILVVVNIDILDGEPNALGSGRT